MNPKDNLEVRKVRYNVPKKRNLHLKYIPLNGRRMNKSEPALTKCGKKPEYRHGKIKKKSEVLKRYPDVANKVKNVPITKTKTNDKLKLPTKTISKKSFQKIKPNNRTKQGFFTETVVSMWHYAKSFFGFNSTENEMKPKRPVYVAKKSSIHHVNKGSKEPRQLSQHYHISEKNIEMKKKIIEIYRHENKSKVNNKPNNKDQIGIEKSDYDDKYKVDVKPTGKEQIKAETQCELKDKAKEYLTYEKETYKEKLISKEKDSIEAKKQILENVEPEEKEEIEAGKQIVLNDEPNNNKFPQQKNLITAETNNETEIETKKLIAPNEELKKDTPVEMLYNHETVFSEKDIMKAGKQIARNNNSKIDSTIEIGTNLNENKSKIYENEEIEVKKYIIIKDKSKKGITIEINTNQSVCEILTKTNCYKTALNDTNTTIIMEIKNASNSIEKNNLNLNYATMDVHKNSENCKENVLSLLNTCNVKQNKIAPSKVRINRKKKAPPKVAKVQPNLDKKKTAPKKKNNKKPLQKKAQHENTKKCDRHRSNKRQNSHSRHGIKRRKCSICRGYISSDHSYDRKTLKDKCDHSERCNICNKRVTCLYHHTKRNHHDKKTMRRKHDSLKNTTTTQNKSTHNFQKKKRTLTVCTNSRRNSFKNKKLKKSAAIKQSSNLMQYTHGNKQISNSSIYSTDSDSDSDRQETTKVLSWCYLHYALNAVQHNERRSRSNNVDENKPFLISYGEFCNVDQAVSKDNAVDSDNSNNNENWNDGFEVTTNFPRHPNSFTDEDTAVSENIYPNSSFYSSRRNFEDPNTDVDLEIPNTTPKNSTDIQTNDYK